MIGIDTNIFIYCLVSSQPEHEKAMQWMDQNQDRLVTTAINVAETLRLLTHRRVFPKPMSTKKAVHLLDTFMLTYAIEVLEEDAEWHKSLPSLLNDNPGLCGNEIHDARIAICLQAHGVKRICTMDSDFTKYPFLTRISL